MTYKTVLVGPIFSSSAEEKGPCESLAGYAVEFAASQGANAGRYLLRKMIAFAAREEATARTELDPAHLRRSCAGGAAGGMLHPGG